MMKETDHAYPCHLLAILIICLLCGIIYSNTLNSPFVFDDAANIKDNPYIRITEFNFTTLYEAAFKSPSPRRPVANISFAINYFFGKYNVSGYHLVNIIIHLINGILVYLLAGIIFKHQSGIPRVSTSQSPNSSIPQSPNPLLGFIPVFTALLFVSHPIQTQSVTYIVQRMTSLSVMFYLLSFILYLAARFTSVNRKRWILWTACGISWILALGSKEIAITLPLVILIYEWYFFQNLNRSWLIRNLKYFLFLFLFLGCIIIAYTGDLSFSEIFDSYAKRDFTMGQRVLTQFRVVVFYIGLLLFPHPSRFNLLHSITTSQSLIEPIATLGSIAIILFLIGLAITMAGKYRLISFCILWFFIHLVIESSVIGLEMIFEHRLYLPMVGFCILFASLLFHLFRHKTTWAVIVFTLIILSLGVGTFLRNSVWQDHVTLLTDVVSKNPRSHRAWNNLGFALAERGDFKEVMHHYRKALQIKPDFADAHYNLGVSLEKQGNFEEAVKHYLKTLKINPRHAKAHNNLALQLENQGKIQEAIDHYTKALQFRPELAEAHNNLGILLEEQERLDQAIDHYRKAVRYRPEFAEAYNNLGIALTRKGKVKEGIEWFFKALKLHPEGEGTVNNLGIAFSRLGDFKTAIIYFTKALEIDPDYTDARQNLHIALQRINASGNPSNATESHNLK